MSLPYTRAEVKERARSEWHGACSVTLPSFTSDFQDLNEAGIRHDIRLAEEFGFWGTLVASECGTTLEEYIRFMEICADEAKDLKLVAHLSFSTTEEAVRAAKAAEEVGFEAALPSYPPTFQPASARDIVDYTADLAARTDLALILFGVATWGWRYLHPAQFPPDALAEMAQLDTAASIKYEAANPGMIAGLADLLRRCGDLVLVQCPKEEYAPGLVEWFGMQWMGTSAYESFGDRVPRWFAMLHEGKWDDAMDLYWSYQSAREAKSSFHKSFSGANLIHRNGWKYLGWLHGFNGGLLRMPQMRLTRGQMSALRKGVEASGFQVPPTDEGFFNGRNPA